MRKLVLLISAIALLSSCHIYKAYERPEVNTQGLYRDTLVSSDTLNFGKSSLAGSFPGYCLADFDRARIEE